jgi:hypothetical protein
MNRLRVIFYVLLIMVIASGNLALAKKSNFTAGTRHLGRNSMVAVANRKLEGYPFAQAVTATGYKITEDYKKGNAVGSEKLVQASVQDHIPYFVVNYSLRKIVQVGSDRGYTAVDVIKKCDIVPESFLKEIVQDTMTYLTPAAQETAYDVATAVIITYLLPSIMERVK